MKFKRIKVEIDENKIVDIVCDALIFQRNVCNGKAIPQIIINTENNPEIAKSILLHKDVKEGEIKFTWSLTTDEKYVFLKIDSISPVEISYWVRFELYKHYEVINRILSAKLLYIQPGKEGERLLGTQGTPKLLLEIPSVGFEKDWQKVYRKIQEKRFKNLGVKKKDLDGVIEIFNREWDSVVNKHFK